jgi:uncharacterized phage protein (TIGR02218 family)
MKTISAGLKAAIEAGKICTLFAIIAKDGTSKYFTDHDTSLTVDGHQYIPSAGVKRFNSKLTANAEVSNQEVMATILDMPDDEIKMGKWDSAQIEVATCAWGDVSQGKLINFKGSIGVIQWTDEGFRADIQNYLRDLSKNIGNTVTANCRHQLYSTPGAGKIGGCNVSRAANLITGTVGLVLTPRIKFKISASGKADKWGSAGFVKFTSGSNSGLTYEVKLHRIEGGAIGESIELYLPTIAQIATGTTFELTAGCDHSFTECQDKFSNAVNFGGFPHLQVDVNANVNAG